MELYKKNALLCSKITTKNYSTSFNLGIKLFHKKYRMPIYAIYGFVRFADEIVDSFQGHNQNELFYAFEKETWKAIKDGISTNPILHSFQCIVNDYNIDHELIHSFLKSMEMDLNKNKYSHQELGEYIYGSAQVVGLMCLQVFYKDDRESYLQLIHPARKLGEAFQKVNFLRDVKDDFINNGRIYFPNVDFYNFKESHKKAIEDEIREDFQEAYDGICKLKKEVRFGIYMAYRFYLTLLHKIERTPPKNILKERYRVSDAYKVWLLMKSLVRHSFNIL